MIRTKTALNLSGYPAKIIPFLAGADIYDSSCSKEARVYFSDKDQGYFRQIRLRGKQQRKECAVLNGMF